MGCGQSSAARAATPEDRAAYARNEEIEKQLKKDREAERRMIKLLLLGAGESGKSTVLKQARLLYQGTYTNEERDDYVLVVHVNLVQSMQVVLEAVQVLGLSLPGDADRHKANAILDYELHEEPIKPQMAQYIRDLWANPIVKEAVRRKREFQLNDSAEYYFDATARLAAADYIPTDDDILRSRVKTTGITETSFKVGELTWRLFDVGGQRSERRKWVHCFEGVNVLLFLIAISEFDQTLYEDNVTNRIVRTVFSSVANSRWFARTTILALAYSNSCFLNKIDLLAMKLRTARLHDYMPEYQGDNTLDSATQFFAGHFRALYQGSKPMYTHLTCATDSKQIQVVLAAVNDSILRENLSNAGYL